MEIKLTIQNIFQDCDLVEKIVSPHNTDDYSIVTGGLFHDCPCGQFYSLLLQVMLIILMCVHVFLDVQNNINIQY